MLRNFMYILVLCSTHAYAMTDEEMKIEFTKFVMKCQQEHPVEIKELMALQALQVPKNKESKCLLACAYKAEGAMNAKGMYDLEHAYKVAELSKNGDEKRFANAKKMAELCAKINDEPVTDGEKGCERAAMLFKCLVTNAPKMMHCKTLYDTRANSLDLKYENTEGIKVLVTPKIFQAE